MRPSIRKRLLVLTTTVISLVVMAVAVVVWLSMSRGLRQQLDETLRAQAIAVASHLEADEGRVQFDWEAPQQASLDLFGDALVLVLDDADGAIFSSPNRWFETIVWPHSGRTTNDIELSLFNVDGSGSQGPLRVIEMRMIVPPSDERPPGDAKVFRARVLVARSTANVDSTLAHLAWTLAGATGVSILAALVGGSLIARHGVRPIVEVSQAIAQVAPEHPCLNIDLQRVPIELDPIIGKTDDLLRRIDRELERQRQLTADVAHDLRTPVAGVRMLLDVCVQRDRNVAEYVETINTARGALRQLSQLLDNVLTLARLDAGAEKTQWVRVRVADVIRDATEMIRPAAVARQVHIECKNESDVHAWSDPSKLVKILTNLLSNAVNYSPSGGLVCIRTTIEPNHLVISVHDSGPGVPPALRESIFDRFVRGDAARSHDEKHHGLGLPIARGLARLMGGDVELAIREGPGAEFRVRLPTRDGP
jgi:two-component system OmpR family sensor kinase